ncbi:beta-1,4-glucuronyltransferase 1-like isoform X3 [Periplaneta americana]|uniref:beta-1,4-glucuronyltransferase 1-like isoform X3 n=1 Tax=Periplaneta americana TaxID=6978 RepID=UPI0037E70EDE
MIQIGCRLWNLSIVSVLILTFSNILLTVRLLHSTDCSRQPAPPPEPPRLEQQQLQDNRSPGRNQGSSASPTPSVTACKLPNSTTATDETSGNELATNSTVFRVDLRLGRWDSRHLYKLYDFALPGDKYADLSDKYSVCLATQSSLEKLQSLVQVAHHWTGPISAAVFAAGDEYPLIQLYIAFLRRCFPVVRDRVSFHLAYPKDRPPSHLNKEYSPRPKLDCRRPEAALAGLMRLRRPETAKWRVKAAYPQNHLRNLARRNCQTSYVFLTDVDIIPSAKLAEGLDVFLKNVKCKNLCAYVIPTYELDERVHFPRNKSDLIRLARKGLARPFHHRVFIYNQFATNFSRWQASAESEGEAVHVNHNVTNFEFLYEPFYVAPDTVPAHDERFIGYGYTRNTQEDNSQSTQSMERDGDCINDDDNHHDHDETSEVRLQGYEADASTSSSTTASTPKCITKRRKFDDEFISAAIETMKQIAASKEKRLLQGENRDGCDIFGDLLAVELRQIQHPVIRVNLKLHIQNLYMTRSSLNLSLVNNVISDES